MNELCFECRREGEYSTTYDRIGASICCPFVECVDVVVSRNVLLDKLVINRLRMHPLAKPCCSNRMERDVF
jgi:hypothetical protein